MDYKERIKLYAKIEQYRGRPLIVYATSTRYGASASMASDAVRLLIDQIDTLSNGDAVDVLIHSSGGDGLTAWKLMSVLRERFSKISVLVPYMAFSAATMFALGADEIIMHPHASLGPIDPQIQAKGPDGQLRAFAYEDVGAFLSFLEKDVKITEQAHFSSIVDKLFSCVDPLTVGAARRASELAISIGERLLSTHMTADADKDRIPRIARELAKSFFAHGDAVSRTRARQLGLQLADDDAQLEQLLWDAYCGIESAMELREQFKPDLHFMADPQALTTIAPMAPVILPPNTPPQLLQNVWTNVANQAIAAAQGPAHQVPFDLLLAVVESARAVAEARKAGYITAIRLPDSIQFTITETKAGWLRYKLEEGEANA